MRTTTGGSAGKNCRTRPLSSIASIGIKTATSTWPRRSVPLREPVEEWARRRGGADRKEIAHAARETARVLRESAVPRGIAPGPTVSGRVAKEIVRVLRETAPVRRGIVPVAKETAPALRVSGPAARGTVPVLRESGLRGASDRDAVG